MERAEKMITKEKQRIEREKRNRKKIIHSKKSIHFEIDSSNTLSGQFVQLSQVLILM